MTNKNPAVFGLIGNTPMMEITQIDTGPCQLFVKLESWNPAGSIKDRVALQMIETAEAEGKIKPGDTIVEATAGNTGLGLTLIGQLKGYKVILVVPDKMSREKVLHCKAMGAEVHLARSDVTKGHPDYYQEVAARIAKETNGFFVNQFSNPANVKAHEKTTAPEILKQMDGNVDAIICGVGSGGTVTGIGNYMKEHSPNTEIIVADPEGSIVEPLVNRGEEITPGSWLVEGIGEDFIPDILDLSLVTKAYSIHDSESLSTVRELLLKEGILAGSSSGALLAAALKYCREQKTPKRVVTLVCDRGDKYLSKIFSDAWVAEQGFVKEDPKNTIEDLVVRRHDHGDAIFVRGTDTLKTAYKRMRSSDVSQLPVLNDHCEAIGIIDESCLLDALSRQDVPVQMNDAVETIMSEITLSLDKDTPVDKAVDLLKKSGVAIVTDQSKFIGLMTRVDVLNYLCLQDIAA